MQKTAHMIWVDSNKSNAIYKNRSMIATVFYTFELTSL